jgi:3-deoxy-D-manno-octulosonic-acid transferase
MDYKKYKFLTSFFAPLIVVWLRFRLWKGKEDAARFGERLGFSKQTRPEGVLVWVHAASVGEVNSAFPLISDIQTRFPEVRILLTTGTVTSAKLVASKKLHNVIHQYIPIDTPEATNRFLRRFRPDIGFWVESELWPNLVVNARARGCFMIIVNGRMSTRSFDKWQKHALQMILQMMSCFELVFAQSEADAQRFRALGARDARVVGNIKYDADVLSCIEGELFSLQKTIENRPVWLAASTHADEEIAIAKAHKILTKNYPNLLTIIAPRHPKRAAEISGKISKYGNVSIRSRAEKITPQTSFYIADTIGELGLFYRLCEIVFMGGSLIPHGGQNPLEPLRLRCAIITGANTNNFAEMYSEMEKLAICERANSPQEIADHVLHLLKTPDALIEKQAISKEWLKGKSGAITRMINAIAPIFAPVE